MDVILVREAVYRRRAKIAGTHVPAVPRGSSAYHLQQAAEKLVKSLLVLAGEPFRRSHDLDDLVARLLPLYPRFTVQAEAVRRLTIWGVAYRCPGVEDEPEPLPDREELQRIADLLQDFATPASALIGKE